jgi:hypothetical protein
MKRMNKVVHYYDLERWAGQVASQFEGLSAIPGNSEPAAA